MTDLQVGSPVRYRGVPVGSGADIRIDPENVERIRVTIDVTTGPLIKEHTIASIGLQGITGIAFSQLTGGSQEAEPLRPKFGQKVAAIPSKLSGLEQVLEKATELFEKAVALGKHLAEMMDQRNLDAIAETLQNVRKITATVSQGSEKID